MPLIARFLGPTWGPCGADRTQVGPMLAPWTLLSASMQQHEYSIQRLATKVFGVQILTFYVTQHHRISSSNFEKYVQANTNIIIINHRKFPVLLSSVKPTNYPLPGWGWLIMKKRMHTQLFMYLLQLSPVSYLINNQYTLKWPVPAPSLWNF